MTNYRAATDYGVGHASDAIVSVRSFGLSVPQVVYMPFQAAYARGDITREGDGPPSVMWVWDSAHIERFAALVRYIFSSVSSQYNDAIYVRTDARVGWYSQPEQAFGVYSAVAWRPLLFGPDGGYAPDTPYQVQAVRLTFKNLVAV